MTKTDFLKNNGTFNPNSDKVTAEEFQHGVFFDPQDLVQVKYEMLRSVEKEDLSVSEASKLYGLSRQTYYNNREAMEKYGMAALLPQKKGPKQASKLKEDGQRFIDSYIAEHPDASAHEINLALAADTGIAVHDKTVSRYLSKKVQGS